MNDFPTFESKKIQFSDFDQPSVPIDMKEMGITSDMYNNLSKVALEKKCVIMIRKTNKGAVMPLSHRVAVGKKLPTKGKSSDAFFTKGSIPFFAQMAKKLDPDKWYEEQTTLISVLGDKTSKNDDKYKYIPKLFTKEFVDDLEKDQDFKAKGGKKEKLKITINKDKIAGETCKVEYIFEPVVWSKVNEEFGGKLVKPYSETRNGIESDPVLYRLFMKVTDIDKKFQPLGTAYPTDFNLFYKDIDGGKSSLKKIMPDLDEALDTDILVDPSSGSEVVSYLADVNWKFFIEKELWKYRKDFPAELKNKGDIIEINSPHYPGDQQYREVRVLGLFTQGSVEEKRSKVSKRYYEVVADYDLFMIAPQVDLFSPQVSLVADSEKDPLIILERIWWSSHEIEKKYLPESDQGKKKYGIFSQYEIEVRKEINKALGIKAVQHGVETANLFHTSDLKDPVIAIYPGDKLTSDSEKSGPLFFLSLDMLFELISGDRTEMKCIDKPPDFNTFNKIWEGANLCWNDGNKHRFANDYAPIFNLNWGTEAYYEFNFGKDKKYLSNKQAFIHKIETSYNEMLKRLIRKEEGFINLFELKGDLKNLSTKKDSTSIPLSVKAFYVFLWRDYSRFTSTKNFIDIVKAAKEAEVKGLLEKAAPKQELKGDASDINTVAQESHSKEARRKVHYKFVKKLMFWSEFYKSVYQESAQFAELVGKKRTAPDGQLHSDVIEIQKIYLLAIKGIQAVLEYYSFTIFPTISQNAEESNSKLWAKVKQEYIKKDWSPILENKGVTDSDKNNYNHPLTTLIPMPEKKDFFYSPFYSALHTYIEENDTWIAKHGQEQATTPPTS